MSNKNSKDLLKDHMLAFADIFSRLESIKNLSGSKKCSGSDSDTQTVDDIRDEMHSLMQDAIVDYTLAKIKSSLVQECDSGVPMNEECPDSQCVMQTKKDNEEKHKDSKWFTEDHVSNLVPNTNYVVRSASKGPILVSNDYLKFYKSDQEYFSQRNSSNSSNFSKDGLLIPSKFSSGKLGKSLSLYTVKKHLSNSIIALLLNKKYIEILTLAEVNSEPLSETSHDDLRGECSKKFMSCHILNEDAKGAKVSKDKSIDIEGCDLTDNDQAGMEKSDPDWRTDVAETIVKNEYQNQDDWRSTVEKLFKKNNEVNSKHDANTAGACMKNECSDKYVYDKNYCKKSQSAWDACNSNPSKVTTEQHNIPDVSDQDVLNHIEEVDKCVKNTMSTDSTDSTLDSNKALNEDYANLLQEGFIKLSENKKVTLENNWVSTCPDKVDTVHDSTTGN